MKQTLYVAKLEDVLLPEPLGRRTIVSLTPDKRGFPVVDGIMVPATVTILTSPGAIPVGAAVDVEVTVRAVVEPSAADLRALNGGAPAAFR